MSDLIFLTHTYPPECGDSFLPSDSDEGIEDVCVTPPLIWRQPGQERDKGGVIFY